MEKELSQFFINTVQSLKKVRVIILPLILSRFSLVSDATNFFNHSLICSILKKKTAYTLLVFFNRVAYMQICPLNACKLD